MLLLIIEKLFSMNIIITPCPPPPLEPPKSPPAPHQYPPQSLLPSQAYKQFSKLFKNYRGTAKRELEQRVEQLTKIIGPCGQQTNRGIEAVTKLLIAEKCGETVTLPHLTQEEQQIASYWANIMNSAADGGSNHHEWLSAGHSLLVGNIAGQSEGVLAVNKCKPYIVYNNMVCLQKFGMLQQALSAADQLASDPSRPISAYAKEVRICILLRMGVRVKQEEIHQSQNQRTTFLRRLLEISNMKRQGLRNEIQRIQKTESKQSIAVWFNLALACKFNGLHQQSIDILQLLTQFKIQIGDKLVNKCNALLSELYEAQGSYKQAIRALKKIEVEDRQVQIKIWCLKKKIKMQKADQSKVQKALLLDPRFSKLNNLENEFKKLRKDKEDHNEKTQIKKKTKKMRIVFKTVKIHQHAQSSLAQSMDTTMLEKPRCQQKASTIRLSHNVGLSKKASQQSTASMLASKMPSNRANLKPQTPRTALTSLKTSLKFIQSNLASPIDTYRQPQAPNPHENSSKDLKQAKEVRFDLSESSNNSRTSLTAMVEEFEERITEQLFEEDFEAAMDSIKDAEDCLEQLQAANRERAVAFIIKLSRWCKQAGKERYATLLLKRVLLRYEAGEHRASLLRELGRHYEELKEYKSAIEVNLQLVRLGKTECLDKLGEMHMLRENYSEALKYYERYHEVRSDTYSLVKLAHAYSKIPSYSKRALELLNDLLFVNKTSCIFHKHAANETDDFQSALLLLVTIYMNLNGHKKAAEICEKYLKEDFGAYPIYYILGVLRLREERREEAFACFLNAVRLKPNHLPSLLELLRFLTSRSAEVLAVLRKAFHAHHRDWELLQMLVEAATKSPSRHAKISIPGLIDCAKALEGAGLEGLDLEIEAVWLWAAELIDDRQKRVSVVDQEFVENVYVRLGDIALKKGNFLLSERYFSKVLQKLQLERGRLTTKPRTHFIKLQIQILRRMAYLKSERREPQEAMALLEQSKNIATANGLPLEAVSDCEKIGQLYFLMENYQKAVEAFRECCRQLEQLPEGIEGNWEKWKDMQMEIGNCHQNTRQWREAKRVYQGILSHRLCEEAIRSLANLYVWQGNPEYAKELLQGLRVLRPTPTLV